MSYRKKYKRPEPVVRVPFKLAFPPSEAQTRMADEYLSGKNNIICPAVAGSGKSTSLAYLMSLAPDQRGIYIAFNVDIVKEMEPKCPPAIDVKTRHSVGMMVYKQNTTKRVNVLTKNNEKNLAVIEEFGYHEVEDDPESYDKLKAICQMIHFCKVNLTDPEDVFALIDLQRYYGFQVEEGVIDKMPAIMKRSNELAAQGIIDFDDMIYYPVYAGMKFPKYDVLFLDEYQDSTILGMEFDSKLLSDVGRTVIVGDSFQSIYSFAGARCDSMDIAERKFGGVHHPLDVTYRCAKKIVDQCKPLVPVFNAFENAPEGKVSSTDSIDFAKLPEDTMFLCRRNAPLIPMCFSALKQGYKAEIRGRDIGGQLIGKINSLKLDDTDSVNRLLDKLRDDTDRLKSKILAAKKPNHAAIEMINDQFDIIQSFCFQSEISNVFDVKKYINSLFKDKRTKGFLFSSGHKSKGLEASHVVIIDSERIRLSFEGMTPEQRDQERNLEYVVKSRGKTEMTYHIKP